MMLLSRTVLRLSGKKIPFLLCGSRFAPIMLRTGQTQTDGNFRKDFSDVSTAFHTFCNTSTSNTNTIPDKKQKRETFDAIVRWCGAHQQIAMGILSEREMSNALKNDIQYEPSLEVDEIVLQWLQESCNSLTCGQSLLVCSFVCEVLLCRLESAKKFLETGREQENSLQRQVEMLTNRIAALLHRANSSDKLESQPLSILMSCVYGVHRLSCFNSHLISETEQTLLKIPTALIFAVLHQLRGDALVKLFQLDGEAAVGVCLSFLLIADEERRQTFLSGNDSGLVNTVIRRLLRHTAPVTKQVIQLYEEEQEIASMSTNDTTCRHTSLLLCGVKGGIPGSPSMLECASILQNISFTSAVYRLELISYLLCVRKKPNEYSEEDIRLIPSVLQTISNVRSKESHKLRKMIITQVPLPINDPVSVAHLFSFCDSIKARFLTYINTVTVESLTSADALQVIRWSGVHLNSETLQRFIVIALPEFKSVLELSSSSTTTSLPVKMVLNNTMECILSTLFNRMTEPSLIHEKEITQKFISQIINNIDWSITDTPKSAKLALRRLLLLTRLSSSGFNLDVSDTAMELIEKTLDLDSGNSMTNTLQSVTEALKLVSETEKRKNIVESMLKYSGTRTSSSMIRFIAFLAPLSMEYGVYNAELVPQFLKLQTLSPFRLRQGSIEGVSKDTDTFTRFIVDSMNYLLSTAEWRTSTDRIREVMTAWIQDYLHYVMSISRKQKALTINTQGEGIHQTSTSNENNNNNNNNNDNITSVLVGPSHTQLERVFLCMLRAGVKLPDSFGSELSARVLQIEKEGAHADGTGCTTHFPPPGHFIFCCKLDIAIESPLSIELLEYLLIACDCRILHIVIIEFLVHGGSAAHESSAILLLANLRIVNHALELFLRRIVELGDDNVYESFKPSSVSSVVANTVRFVVTYMTKKERNQRLLQRLNSLNKKEKIIEENVKGGDVESNDDILLIERARVEDFITRLIGYLSSAHTKDVGLLLIDKLTLLAPGSADFLMLRLRNQLEEFTQVELFYLARKYPQAEQLVIKELQKHDIALTVDLSDHVRVAKNLPMSINVMVIEAHLPKLTFQWCTRLLSTLSVRQGSIPTQLLISMLKKLEEEAVGVTVMDRNVALVVLQKYLKEDPGEMDTNTNNNDNNNNSDNDSNSNNVEIREQQQRLIQSCCDKLLVLDDIKSLDSLTEFLSSFPDVLRSTVGVSLTERVVSVVLPPLQSNLEHLLTLCRLMQKHKLLNDIVRLAVTENFFETILRKEVEEGNNNNKKNENETGDSVDETSSSSPAVYSLSNVLALAMLLAEESNMSIVSCNGNTSNNNSGVGVNSMGISQELNITSRVLRSIKDRYSSLPDRLLILNTLVEQKEAIGGVSMSNLTVKEICEELIRDCEKMTSSEFSRFLQCISRLKYWHVVKTHKSNFVDIFQSACQKADAHSRCVLFKAISSEIELFRGYESFMIPLLAEVVDVMSKENLEMVLSAILGLPLTEALESLIDAIGTRVLSMVNQCRRSTLIRMLQCHATFGLQDDALVVRLLSALEEQCGRDVRLDITQALTLLQAVVDLDVPIPSKLAVTCFSWLEHHIDSMTMSQLGHAARLAVAVEMGYTASVHALVMRALEQRDAIRSNATFRKSVELLCDEFSVETPWHLKATVMRRRYQSERLKAYVEKKRTITMTETLT